MTTPSKQTLTITLRDGKHVRARVIYLQPKPVEWRKDPPGMHVVKSEWIESCWHAGEHSSGGKLVPHCDRLHDNRDWRFEGRFQRNANT